MALSNDLISQFVKTTKDTQYKKKETVVYGTISQDENGNYNNVIIDGSNISTPVVKTVAAGHNDETGEDDRVMVTIKNHTAIVTGNLSSNSARVIDTVNVSNLKAYDAKIEHLEASEVDVTERLSATEADIVNLKATDAEITGRLTANEADIEYLKALDIDTEKLNAAYAFVDDLEANHADVDYLVSTVADIDKLIFGSASGDVIQTSFSNAVIAQLGDAQIKSAMIESVSADKITAGDIITNNVRVRSEDGSLVISDETLQISDSTRVRVQIGKDAANDYSINIWDQNGNLMFSKGGITDAAIKQAIIRNDMVSDTANIHASKLDIDSLFEEINDSANVIKSTRVFLDDKKQTLDVAFKSLTTEVTEQGETISSQGTAISTIQGQISSKVWQQDINTAKNEMSTQYSTLEQEVDGFKSTVSETYATQVALSATDAKVTNAQNDIDNLEIGGRNLVPTSYLSEIVTYGIKFQGNSTKEFTAQSWVGNAMHNTRIKEKFVSGGTYTIYCEMEIVELPTYTDNGFYDNNVSFYIYSPTTNNDLSLVPALVEGTKGTLGAKYVLNKTFVFPTITDDTYLALYTCLYKNASGGAGDPAKIKITNFKIEKGNKATDWTPAPEDMESDITSLSTQYSEIKQTVDGLSTTVSSHTSEISKKADSTTVTNVSDRVSSLEQDVNGFKTTVSSTYATKTEIDDIEIGGRNFIIGSRDLNGTGATNYNGKIVLDNGFTAFKCTGNWHGVRYDANNLILNSNVGDTFTYSINIKTSGICKLSFYAMCYEPDGTRVYPAHASGQFNDRLVVTTPEGEQDKRVYITFSVTQGWIDLINEGGTVKWTLQLYDGVSSDNPVYLYAPKLERGNKPTDWTPAPEDAETDINNISTRVSTNESSITQLSNRITTNVTEITDLGTRATTLEQTSSSLTSRITIAENDILEATKTATNYLNFSSSGLVVGDMTASTLGKNVLIDSDSVDIRNGTTTLASFGANTIYLGKDDSTSVINLCNGSATMKVVDDTDFRIYTDKRLVMSAYQSMLLDCYRDSTHMTRIAIQSSDPDQSSVVGGVQFTIYQDDIRNTVQMLNNDITLRVTDDVNTTRLAMRENIMRLCSTGAIYINSESAIQIGESSSDIFSVRLGSSYNKAKSIGCYWNDGEAHDLITHAANGQNSYFGPSDISITDSSSLTSTTNIRGKYIRLYNHAGGGVYLGSSGSTAVTSDRNLKKDILDIDDKYLDFFDRLRPITYKYDCPENKGHRDHVGFIAQEVEEALTASGLTTEQFAGLVIERDVTLNPNYDSSLSDEENTVNETHYDALYSLRYEEFISLLVKKVQSLQEQLNQLRADK